jgi:hypothetical protein
MSDVDRLKDRLQQATKEFDGLDEWERDYLIRKLRELGRPIADPNASLVDESGAQSTSARSTNPSA